MAVTMAAPALIGSGVVLLSWSSDLGGTPTFRIYLDGELLTETTGTTYVLTQRIGDTPVIEVRDDDSPPAAGLPGRVRLEWTPVAGAAEYRVEEFVAAAWTQRARVKASDIGTHVWFTRFLEDEATHQFRIVPVGENGNDGTPLAFSFLMVRSPDPPDVSYAYNPGPDTVTITEN